MAESADPGGSESEAIRLGHQGRKFFDQGDCSAALEKFRTAEQLAHSPVFILYAARCLKKLGRWLEARSTYVLVANETMNESAPVSWFSARADAKLELENIERELPQLSLSIAGVPQTAISISVDESPLPLPVEGLPLDPGQHSLQASSGEQLQKVTFDLRPGTHQTLVLRFDVQHTEPTPTRAVTANTGFASGARASNQLAPSRRSVAPWLWISAGVAGTSLLVGGISGTLALVKRHDLDCPDGICIGDDRSTLLHARRWADVATVSFIVAGTASAGAVGLWLLGGSSDRRKARLRLTVGAGALIVDGSF